MKIPTNTLTIESGEQMAIRPFVAACSRITRTLLIFLIVANVHDALAGEIVIDFKKLKDGPLWGQDGWETPSTKQPTWRSPVVAANADSEISAQMVTACSEIPTEPGSGGSDLQPVGASASRFVDLSYSGQPKLVAEFTVRRTSKVNDAIGGVIGVGSTDRYPATAGLFFGGWAIREEATSPDGVGGQVHLFRYKRDGSPAGSERNHWYQVRVTYTLSTKAGGDPSASIEIKDITAGEKEFSKLYIDSNGERGEASLGLSSQVANWDNLVIRLGSSEVDSIQEGGAIAGIRIYWSKE